MTLKLKYLQENRYVLLATLTFICVFGELCHFILGTVTRQMARDLHYGTKECLQNEGITTDVQKILGERCLEAKDANSCLQVRVENGTSESNKTVCSWNYSGLGIQYQILAGPSFIAVFTISGVLWGIVGDRFSRLHVLKIATSILTIAITLTGLSISYWQLVFLRMSIGAGVSAISPMGISLLSETFLSESHGFAVGIFNWGIYLGYGMSYILGNFLNELHFPSMGWRMSYYISGLIGSFALMATFLFIKELNFVNNKSYETNNSKISSKHKNIFGKYILKEEDKRFHIDTQLQSEKEKIPHFDTKEESNAAGSSEFHCTNSLSRDLSLDMSTEFTKAENKCGVNLKHDSVSIDQFQPRSNDFKISIFESLIHSLSQFKNIPILLLTVGACVRHTAGFTWAYNTQLYFNTYYPSYNLGIWISAVSILGGSVGVAFGGIVSDKLVQKIGLRARAYVLSASQLIATPFATGVIYLTPPVAFYSLLLAYLFAEMWFGVLYATLLELFPLKSKSTSLALFIFIINNIGGCAPMLIEPIREIITYRQALLIMYPGLYLLSSFFFLFSSLFLPNRIKKKEES